MFKNRAQGLAIPMIPFEKFDVILLDMCGTFMFDHDRVSDSEEFYSTYQKLGGISLPEANVQEYIQRARDLLLADYEAQKSKDNFPQFKYYLNEVTDNSLSKNEYDLLSQVFAHHEVGHVPKEYVNTIENLSKNHRLGVVSNIWGPSEIFHQRLEENGVKQYFESIVFSSDHSCIKPSKRIFEASQIELGFDKLKTIYVGDSYACDVVGAKDFGIAVAWLSEDHQKIPAHGTHEPDFILKSLLDLQTTEKAS